MRSGHTEAAVDLVRLAGLPPVGVICELANDDGTIRAGPQIEAFAQEHKLTRISVADLIAYRQAREKIVKRVQTFAVEGPSGPLTGYAYMTLFDPVQHFAFVQGEIGDGRDMPTRLHRANIIADVITGGESIRKTFASFKKNGRGCFIYLRDGTAGVPVTIAGERSAESEAQRTSAWREIGLGAQILRDLGISSIRLRTSRPMTYVGLSGFGVEIVSSEGVD
jgi:3,4-dihydroxy 2-butanone 4-phosphate synthase / GTP cyclohydrolase II